MTMSDQRCAKCLFEKDNKCKLNPPIFIGDKWDQPDVQDDDYCSKWEDYRGK